MKTNRGEKLPKRAGSKREPEQTNSSVDEEALLSSPVERLSKFFLASEILSATGPELGIDADAFKALHSMAGFVAKHLTETDPRLGREGPICPFARDGTRTGGIRFANCDISHEEEAILETVMAHLRTVFLQRDEIVEDVTQHIMHAFVITFSKLSVELGAPIIERVQKTLKTSYVSKGLMIGQFFPGCQEEGVRNPEFRPLDSPVVSLAIRHMTEFDAPFMLENPCHGESFVKYFGDMGASQLRMARSRRLERQGTLKSAP